MVEVCAGGLDHFAMFDEFIRLSRAQGDAVKPYGRPEFDKWLKGFDVGADTLIGGCPIADG